jgi:putative ABC transport system ATP-binding protein
MNPAAPLVSEASATPVILVRDLVKTYQIGSIEVRALRGVSLSIERGELMAIMGPSGSGKSTLMNILGCLDQPTSGSYYLDGAEVSRLNDNQLSAVRNRKIGFVFQTFNLLPRVAAVEQVELPLIYAGVPNRRRRALDALARVGLANRVNHRPTELSGGSNSVSRSLGRSSAIPESFSRTSRPETSTRAHPKRSRRSFNA